MSQHQPDSETLEDQERDEGTEQDEDMEPGAEEDIVLLDEIRPRPLSRGTRRLMRKRAPGRQDRKYILELHNPIASLFFPFNTKHSTSPNVTVTKQGLGLLLSLVFAGVALRFMPSDWGWFRLIALAPTLIALVVLYERLDQWRSYSLNVSYLPLELILLAQPLSVPVGTTIVVPLSICQYVEISTLPDDHTRSKLSPDRGVVWLKSLIAGMLGLQWLTIDVKQISQDKKLHGIGPFRDAAYVRELLLQAIDRAQAVDRLQNKTRESDWKVWRDARPYATEAQFLIHHASQERKRQRRYQALLDWRERNPEAPEEEFDRLYERRAAYSEWRALNPEAPREEFDCWYEQRRRQAAYDEWRTLNPEAPEEEFDCWYEQQGRTY